MYTVRSTKQASRLVVSASSHLLPDSLLLVTDKSSNPDHESWNRGTLPADVM